MFSTPGDLGVKEATVIAIRVVGGQRVFPNRE
jgi:hypothetical protein